MRLRIIFSVATSFAFSSVFAQDRLYTKEGSVLEVKVKEVGTRTIVYKKWNNQDGPDFIIAKNEVERIKFQNGDEEYFTRRGDIRPVRTKTVNRDYGKNILSFSPVHMTNASAIGIGVSYERVIDKKSIVSFYLPVVYSFRNNRDDYNYNTGNYYENKSHMVWFYPGAKIYPTGSDGIVRYAVGPSLAFGAGERNYTRDVFNQATSQYEPKQFNEDVFIMGVLVNNSLNIQPSPKLHLGLELGLGIPYYSNEQKNNDNYYNSFYDEPLVQFNFNVGYRF